MKVAAKMERAGFCPVVWAVCGRWRERPLEPRYGLIGKAEILPIRDLIFYNFGRSRLNRKTIVGESGQGWAA